MDYKDIIPTLKYAVSTPPLTLLEQLRDEVKNAYTKENVPPSAKNSQLVSGARRDYQNSKYSENPSMKEEPGVIMTPEVIKDLEAKRAAIDKKIQEREAMRRVDEYDQMVRARRMKVQDTLEKTGLNK
jgi:hypothetical protein